MKLQTKIPLKKQSDNIIDYHSKLLLLGSCFSENIGEKCEYYKLQSVSNPFGILFHPKAIENLVVNAIQNKKYLEKDLFFNNEQWHCFDAHSKLSNTSKEALLKVLNEGLALTHEQITIATHIVITLGTSWVYSKTESNKIVANCHKVPQKEFKKKLLSIKAIEECLNTIVTAIQSVNTNASIIFTVSPVRHIKDGFIENMLSKSHLISAIHSTLKKEKRTSYFPSYEIMIDELRDYRFYKTDMLHPNETAIQYIWEKFQEMWISLEANNTMKQVEIIQKGIAHKPFNPNSDSYKLFLRKLEVKKMDLKARFNHFNF